MEGSIYSKKFFCEYCCFSQVEAKYSRVSKIWETNVAKWKIATNDSNRHGEWNSRVFLSAKVIQAASKLNLDGDEFLRLPDQRDPKF